MFAGRVETNTNNVSALGGSSATSIITDMTLQMDKSAETARLNKMRSQN